MFIIIDSGTTNSRAYLVEDNGTITVSCKKKVGVRDTSITGSRDALRNGLVELVQELLQTAKLDISQIRFAIASGMITSEIGLIDLPHLTAPAGLDELSRNIYPCEDPAVLPIGCPVYFIRGVKNAYAADANIHDLCEIDFMRGEEVQCIGIQERLQQNGPCNIVVLSSHTKIIFCDQAGRIAASKTTLSGQLYEALIQATNIGKSLLDGDSEEAYGYSYEDLVDTAFDCVQRDGLVRVLLMPRFMQVLLQTSGEERRIFTDAAIAADDLKAFAEMQQQGLLADRIILFGHAERCRLYTYLLRSKLHITGEITAISDPAQIDQMTVEGVLSVAKRIIQTQED